MRLGIPCPKSINPPGARPALKSGHGRARLILGVLQAISGKERLGDRVPLPCASQSILKEADCQACMVGDSILQVLEICQDV